jgi:hypothetical protein
MTTLKRFVYGLAPVMALAAFMFHPMSWRW